MATWPLKSICHRSLGASCSKRMNGFAPPPCNPSSMPLRRKMPVTAEGDRVQSPLCEQDPRDLAPAPGRVRRPHRKRCRLDLRRAAPWARARPPRALRQPCIAFRAIARDQLVSQRPADPEASAQRAHIRSLRSRQPDEFQLLFHRAAVPEWHPEPPRAKRAKLFAMSSHTCSRCLRSKQEPVVVAAAVKRFITRAHQSP